MVFGDPFGPEALAEHTCRATRRLAEHKWVVSVDQQDAGLLVHTIGLTWFGVPELALLRVPLFAMRFAVFAVTKLGFQTLDEGPLRAGEILPLGLGDLQVMVVESCPQVLPLPRCAQVLGTTPYRVWEIVPVGDEQQPLR